MITATDTATRTEELFRRAGALREGHFRLKSGRHSDRYLEKFQVLQYPEITSELCGMLAAFGRGPDGPPAHHGEPGPAGLSAQEALAAALRRAYPVSRRVAASEDLAAATILAAMSPDWHLVPAPADATAPVTVDVVAGPTTGGVILAFETARQLRVRSLFAEEVRDASGTHREFRRGFALAPGERVLLVDDILTTGGSLAAMLPAVERFGATVVHAVVLVDRSGGQATIASPASGRTYPLSALWRLELPTWEAGDACPGCRAGLPLEEPGSGGAVEASRPGGP